MLLTEGAMGEITAWKNVNFLPYGMLRTRWQKILLDAIESELGKAKFRNLKNKLYNKLEDGFYVYGKNEVKDAKGAAKYIGTYLSVCLGENEEIVEATHFFCSIVNENKKYIKNLNKLKEN